MPSLTDTAGLIRAGFLVPQRYRRRWDSMSYEPVQAPQRAVVGAVDAGAGGGADAAPATFHSLGTGYTRLPWKRLPKDEPMAIDTEQGDEGSERS